MTLCGLAGCGDDVSALGSGGCGDDQRAGLVGVDPAGGAVRFTVPVDERANYPRVLTSPGTVYAAAGDGQFGAYDRTTGAVRWCVDQVGSPAGVADELVLVADSGTLVALDLRTGAHRWTAALPDAGDPEFNLDYGPAVAAGPGWIAVHTGASPGGPELVGIDPADGTIGWTRTGPSCSGSATPPATAPPPDRTTPSTSGRACVAGGEPLMATDGTSVFYGQPNAGTVVAVDGTDGTERWTHGGDARVVGVAGDAVVTMDAYPGVLRALDRATGVERWADPSVQSTTMVAGATLVAFEQQSSFPAPAPAPGDGSGDPSPQPAARPGGPRPDATVVHGYDPVTGTRRWSTTIPRLMWNFGTAGALALAGGSEDLAAVDAHSGELLWLADHPSPVVTRSRPSPSGYRALGGDADGIVGVVTASEPYRD